MPSSVLNFPLCILHTPLYSSSSSSESFIILLLNLYAYINHSDLPEPHKNHTLTLGKAKLFMTVPRSLLKHPDENIISIWLDEKDSKAVSLMPNSLRIPVFPLLFPNSWYPVVPQPAIKTVSKDLYEPIQQGMIFLMCSLCRYVVILLNFSVFMTLSPKSKAF